MINIKLHHLLCHQGHLFGEQQEEVVAEGQTMEEAAVEALVEEEVVVLTWVEGEVEQPLVVEEVGQ